MASRTQSNRPESRRLEEARRGVEHARRRLEQVGRRLLWPTPEAFDSSAASLQSAIASLQLAESELRSTENWPVEDRAAVWDEVHLLRRELGRVKALAENAARLYRMRASLLSTEEEAPANYTPVGAGVPSRRDGTVVMIHG